MIRTRPCKSIDPSGLLAAFRQYVRVPQSMHLDPVWEDACFTPDLPDPLRAFDEVKVDGKVGRYLGWSQNDAQVIATEFDKSSFKLTINHYDVWRLAGVLDENHPWRQLREAFPVTLEFVDVESLEIVRIVEQGAAQKLRSSMRFLSKRLDDIRTIRCVGASPERQSFLIVARGCRRGYRRAKKVFSNTYEDSYYIALSCRYAEVHEKYREPWELLFGKSMLSILDRFDSVWPQPLWAICEFENWLEESGFEAPR